MAQQDLSQEVPLRNVGVTRSETNRRSFVDAAWDKYHVEMTVDDCIGIYMPKKGPARITDSGHMILPWRVHMTDLGITEAGQYSDMAAMGCNVTELDLAQNNITSLEEVVQVIRCMPKLVFLNLTNNPLHSSTISLALQQACLSLSHLPLPSNQSLASTAAATAGSCSSQGQGEAATTPTTPTSDIHPTSSDVGNAAVSPTYRCQSGEGLEKAKEGVQEKNTSSVTSSTTEATTQEVKKTSSDNDRTNANIETNTTTLPSPSDVISTSPGNDNVGASTETVTSDECPGSMETNKDDDGGGGGGGVISEDESQVPVSPEVAAFSNLRQLVLNDTGVEWRGIVGLLKLFPALEELHLSLNHYQSVDIPAGFVYPSLTRLFFNNNEVSSWSHICQLGRTFPALEQLFLADTSLTSLQTGEELEDEDEQEEGAGGGQPFASLVLLSLNKTQLAGWEEVDRLREFPALCDVRLINVPFLERIGSVSRRQQLVARLPNIMRLNGSTVTAEERLDAERAFIRLFMDEETKPQRYYELVEVYGQLDPLVRVDLAPKTLFQVVVVNGEQRHALEVNSQQTVRELKKALQNVAGLPCNKFHLLYLDKQCAFGADKLKFPDKKLYTYNLADGDEFIILPKD